MKRSKLVAPFALALALAVPGLVGAQEAAKPAAKPAAQSNQTAGATNDDNAQYKAKTVYDFDDDMVEGDLQRPDGELIQSNRDVKHSSLIEIRKDFIPEMLKSLEDV